MNPKMARRGLRLSKIDRLKEIEGYGGAVSKSFSQAVVVDTQVTLEPNELSTHHLPRLDEALGVSFAPA